MSRRTRQVGASVVGVVGVQTLLNGPRCDRERPSPGRSLDRLEVQPVGRAGDNQRFDFADDLGVERRLEPPFLAASCETASLVSSSASAHRSQAPQYASTSLRNC
jgi:hypothetical protein